MITQEDLKSILKYDPQTGVFTWKTTRNNRVKVGQIAGSKDKDGYKVIKINGKMHKAHRLVWFYMTGSWPEGKIDHINRCVSDNRWENLRVVTDKQNSYNRSPKKGAKSDYKGVYFIRHMNKWTATISKNGSKKYVGFFDTEIDAAVAYNKEAEKLFGPYAYLNEV